jgi:hypothetical protein
MSTEYRYNPNMSTIEQRIEELRQEKTRYSTDELDRRGWARYAEISQALEAQHRGEFVMIEVDSGEYFLGETPQQALGKARAAHPGKAFCLIRVGYRAAHKLKRL